jgi:endonuclease III
MAERISVRKMRRLRPLLAKHYKLSEPPERRETVMENVMMAVLWDGEDPAHARAAFTKLTEEFVDWNDLRVSPTTEVEAVLASCGVDRSKAFVLKRLLSKAVEDFYSLEFERLDDQPRERVRAWFQDIEGLPHHLMAAVLYRVYEYDRMLVGEDVARVIIRLGLASETATPQEIEAALAKVVPAKEAHQMYHALRSHAVKVCTKTDFDCPACPLRGESETGKKRLAEIEAAKRAERAAQRAKVRAAAAKAKAKAKAAAAKAKVKAREKAKAAKRKAAPKKK